MLEGRILYSEGGGRDRTQAEAEQSRRRKTRETQNRKERVLNYKIL